MLKMRLKKGKNQNYRIVVIDSRKARNSAYIENIGTYCSTKKILELNNDRYRYWKGVGAQPSETVEKLAVINGAIDKCSKIPFVPLVKK